MGGGRDGEELVRAGQVAARPSGRCWPTACRASRRARPTRTSISERRRPSRCESAAAGRTLGFDALPDRGARRHPRGRAPGCGPGSPPARTATWTGWPRRRSAAPTPRALWPEVRSVIMLGMNYGPDDDPLAVLGAARRRHHLGLCPPSRLSRVIKGKLKDLAGCAGAPRPGQPTSRSSSTPRP